MNPKSVKSIRRVERPRPLKLGNDTSVKSPLTPPIDSPLIKKSISEVINDLDALHINISGCVYDETTAADITKMCNILKSRGHELDATKKDILDRFFVTLRNVSREKELDVISRLKLMEIIEMRAMNWRTNENLTNYYKKKIMELEEVDKLPANALVQSYSSHLLTQAQVTQPTSVPLAPGEIIRSSGKFAKPTKIAGKNYFKDEVIIRNSDSGKVMGIKGRRVHMIEELSDTIISFQRVNPGARDRLVQITGPHEEAISHAKLLVEDTIRRNASPVREKAVELDGEGNEQFNINSYEDHEVQNFAYKKQLTHSYSMGDATSGEYSFEINIGSDVIRISGANIDTLKTAQLVLQEYFTGQAEMNEKSQNLTDTTSVLRNENIQGFKLNKMPLKNGLQRASSWTGNNADDRRASISPLDSSSDEDDTFRDQNLKNDFSLVEDNSAFNTNQDSDLMLPSFINLEQSSGDKPTSKFPKIAYTRDFLIDCAKSPICLHAPKIDSNITEVFPYFLKEPHTETPSIQKEDNQLNFQTIESDTH